MRFRPNRRGIYSLMKTNGAGAAVRRAAERIAGSAGDGFRTDSALGRRRWRAAVIGNYDKPRDAEGTRSALLRGLDGGRE
ncbi:hypothetical protein FQU76_28315 [Streptomyces qinzhouensis]|uniref:Uncharacterized protein n=1 Tax=Streptomyces qinzhouensis TaxID=2599401 RepID=A0A5B8IMG3_9ACTN|nr:hypothetical protein FQU76_28315 [Streptomyces qinzhouensis]